MECPEWLEAISADSRHVAADRWPRGNRSRPVRSRRWSEHRPFFRARPHRSAPVAVEEGGQFSCQRALPALGPQERRPQPPILDVGQGDVGPSGVLRRSLPELGSSFVARRSSVSRTRWRPRWGAGPIDLRDIKQHRDRSMGGRRPVQGSPKRPISPLIGTRPLLVEGPSSARYQQLGPGPKERTMPSPFSRPVVHRILAENRLRSV